MTRDTKHYDDEWLFAQPYGGLDDTDVSCKAT